MTAVGLPHSLLPLPRKGMVMKTLILNEEDYKLLLRVLGRLTDTRCWLNSKWLEDASVREIVFMDFLVTRLLREARQGRKETP